MQIDLSKKLSGGLDLDGALLGLLRLARGGLGVGPSGGEAAAACFGASGASLRFFLGRIGRVAGRRARGASGSLLALSWFPLCVPPICCAAVALCWAASAR